MPDLWKESEGFSQSCRGLLSDGPSLFFQNSLGHRIPSYQSTEALNVISVAETVSRHPLRSFPP